jgi:hypothetical protein
MSVRRIMPRNHSSSIGGAMMATTISASMVTLVGRPCRFTFEALVCRQASTACTTMSPAISRAAMFASSQGTTGVPDRRAEHRITGDGEQQAG